MSNKTFIDPLVMNKKAGEICEINGTSWRLCNYGSGDTLTTDLDKRTAVTVEPKDSSRYKWEYSIRVAPETWLRFSDYGDTLVDTCHAAVEFCPQVVVLDYLGQSIQWYKGPHYLYGSIWCCFFQGAEACVTPNYDGEYRWWRCTDTKNDLFEVTSLHGASASLEKAMMASIVAQYLSCFTGGTLPEFTLAGTIHQLELV